MNRFSLFGHDFSLVEGTNQFSAIGGEPIAGSIELSSSGRRMTVTLRGAGCGATLDLKFSASVQETGGRVTLASDPTGAPTNRLTLRYSRDSEVTLTAPRLVRHADPRIGLAVLDSAASAFTWVGRSGRLPPNAGISLNGPGAQVHLDVPRGANVHVPVTPHLGPYVSWHDHFTLRVGPSVKRIGPTQTLEIAELSIGQGSFELAARPTSGALFLHADLLDTIRFDDNEFLFQYAVANGVLRVRGDVDGASSKAFWTGDESIAADLTVVLFRHQDEHGHPIAFVPDPGSEIPLAYRPGAERPVVAETDAAHWDCTNAAMVIGPNDGAASCSLPGRVQALDALSLLENFADVSRPKNSLNAPSFLVDGVVMLSAAPLEIHGLSRGTWLRREKDKDVKANLDVAGVAPGPIGFGFHHTSLSLADAADWSLVSLTEERDVAPQARTTSGEVGAYRFPGISGEVKLASVDLQYALSNLAGPERRNSAGLSPGTGKLLSLGQGHLRTLELQFSGVTPTRFRVADLVDQRHTGGARIFPARAQPFSRVLDELSPSAKSVDDVFRQGPLLASSTSTGGEKSGRATFRSKLVFGGTDDGGIAQELEAKLDAELLRARTTVGEAFSFFERSWRGNARHPLMPALREALGIEPRPDTLGSDDNERNSALLESAIGYIEASRNLDDITDDPEALLLYLGELTADEFAAIWTAAPEPGLAELLEHVWAPANQDLMRRVARFIETAPNAAELALLLFNSPDASALGALIKIFDEPASGLLAEIARGADSIWEEVVGLWANGVDPVLIALRNKYGPLLSRSVYARLLDASNATDAAQLLEVICSDLGYRLARLGDLATDPPEYVFRTTRFRVERADDNQTFASLWSKCFHLCGFSDEKLWRFFLDDETSVVIKLSQKRTLPQILAEVEEHYRSADRPNPLGLPGRLEDFLASLDSDLLAPSWTGAFFIRPVADLSGDAVLRDLVGFDHITASYVAVSGTARPSSALNEPPLQVWAHVFKENGAGSVLARDPSREKDLQLALTKFDVRVRKTRLSDANIEVELYPLDVWGRKSSFEKLVLLGRLEAAKDPNASPDLVFGASFPKPATILIDLAFVKALLLRSLRVARRGGTTCIEIAGALTLQNFKGLDLQLALLDAETQLSLQDFRIPIPRLPGVKVEVGTKRHLGFDFSALRIALPKARAFNLFGIELVPRGLGYVRGSEEGLARLRESYWWLTRLELTADGPGFFLPYMEFDVDFGKLPSFGLADARGLRFSLALALEIEAGRPSKAYLGISGLDAKDLKINLFGLLSLETDRFRITPAKLKKRGEPPPAEANAGALLVEQIRLKILDWSPVPESARFDLVFLHPTADQVRSQRKGMLAVYDAKAAPDPGSPADDGDKFFQVFWVILAHNLELPSDVLNHLLGGSAAGDPIGLLQSLISKPPESSDPHSARTELTLDGVQLLERESWLFGISFALGDIFKRCNLIFHDQHYYGIHLWADWVQAVFKQDSIELAYIPGPTRASDRFRTNLRIPAFNMLGSMKSGEFALEWAVNWDFLIDLGFPWRTSVGYDWFRSFSVPIGVYEGKFGFYFEKRSVTGPSSSKLVLSAGMGIYVGYFFGAGNSVAWVRAGIGVFAILQGSITFRAPKSSDATKASDAILRASIESLEIIGVVGIMAYGEGGIDIWIISASFRVSAQASLECRIFYLVGGSCSMSYRATLAAAYAASVRIGCGFFSWTFKVSGEVAIGVSGQLLLS